MNQWSSAADRPGAGRVRPGARPGRHWRGEPGGPEHLAAIQALDAVAARLLGNRVPPLKGRWWVEDDRPPLMVPRAHWRWHPVVRLPASIQPAALAAAGQATGLPTAAPVQQVRFASGQDTHDPAPTSARHLTGKAISGQR